MLWRLSKKSVAMSYEIERSPEGVDEMSVAMSYDIATLKDVVRQTSLDTSVPSHTDIAMSSRLVSRSPYIGSGAREGEGRRR
eukprot:5629478-Karenia_brevis.AAC.1